MRAHEKDYSVDKTPAPAANTQGVFGWGKRGKFESQYQTGSGTAHHFKEICRQCRWRHVQSEQLRCRKSPAAHSAGNE